MVAEEKTVIECQKPKLATRRVARAHVSVEKARRLSQSVQQAVGRVAQTLSRELGKAVSIQGRLLPSLAKGHDALADSAAFAQFDLGALGEAALLELETPIAGAFVDALAGGPAAASAPYAMTSAERAALGFLALVVVRCFRDEATLDKLLAPRFVRVSETSGEVSGVASALGAYLVFELKLRIAECQGMGRLLVPAAPVAALCNAQPPEVGRPLRIRAEVPAAVIGPRVVLDEEDVAGLAVGDVVMVPEAKVAASRFQGPATLRTETFRLGGGFGPKGFTVQTVQSSVPMEEAMSQNNAQGPARPAPNGLPPLNAARPPPPPPGAAAPRPPAPPAVAVNKPPASPPPAPGPTPAPAAASPAATKALSLLPIEIEVELARIKLPLADLANVEPGAILPLHIATTAGVVLRIGEKLIARAELVDIEGELGARITEVSP